MVPKVYLPPLEDYTVNHYQDRRQLTAVSLRKIIKRLGWEEGPDRRSLRWQQVI